MIRKILVTAAAAALAVLVVPSMAAARGQASSLDSAKAKDFVGDWVLTMEGRRGPQERPLAITDKGGKVAAELSGGRGGPVSISDISMNGADLVLKWNQQGPQGEIGVVMTLTLSNGSLTVKQDMAGGQFSQTGTGKKKG
ncbi:MAG TPA: hypothetical protein PLH72_18280 [Vicinamibacterales bacterium]|nr:hypothetical protein [Dehalococcoidia bacterium]HQZ40978.1 hypothetical protein [Vicinamibacterales bacterium]